MPSLLKETVARGAVGPPINANLRPLPGIIGKASMHREIAVEIDPLDSYSLTKSNNGYLH